MIGRNLLKKFKRLPRSDTKNDDKMAIDAKKWLFPSNEGTDSEVAKKLKSSDGSKPAGDVVLDNQVNAGLTDQACEKK